MSSKSNDRPQGFSTRAVHAGEARKKPWDSLTTPIYQTSTFLFHDTDTVKLYTSKQLDRFEYGRYGGPTERAAGQKIADLEGAEDVLLFASGMCAATTTMLALLSSGDHIVVPGELYKKTLQFILGDLPRYGIRCTRVPIDDVGQIKAAIEPGTKMIFVESPTNPYLRVADIPKLAAVAKQAGVVLAVDSTFATPLNLRPLELGADLVIHSVTKYLAGHNDILAGAVLGSNKQVEPIRVFHKKLGGIIDPHACYLLIRGLKTLALRVQQQNSSAMKIAQFLHKHPKVRQTFYPGLPSHPDHRVAKRLMGGFGGVVTLLIDGPLSQVNRFINSLKLCFVGPTLGGVETLVYHPASTSYYDVSKAEREALGITDQLIRIAVGVEDTDDLIADLDQALGHVKKRRKPK